jgi:hypothetical protein
MDGGMKLFDQPQQMLQLTEILETIVSNPNIRAEVEKSPKEQQGIQCETVAQVQETAAATTAIRPAQCWPAMEPGDDMKAVKEEPVTPGAAKRLNGTDKVSSRTKCPSFLKTLTENSLNSWMVSEFQDFLPTLSLGFEDFVGILLSLRNLQDVNSFNLFYFVSLCHSTFPKLFWSFTAVKFREVVLIV